MADNPFWTTWDLSYLPDVYGPIYGGHSVQEAAYNTLEIWFPAYIREMNRKLGGTVLEIPKEYRYRYDYDPEPRLESPKILVVVPGTVDTPERYQTNIRSIWHVEVSCFLFGTSSWEMVQAKVLAYTACIRAIMVQQGGLGGLAETTKWMGETYKEGEHNANRVAGLGVGLFEVSITNTMNPFGGPPSTGYGPPTTSTPSMFPPEPAPIVITTHEEITKEEP